MEAGFVDHENIKRPQIEFLKRYRKLKGMTQRQVADKANINLRYYQRLEQGERNLSDIPYGTVSSIAKALGVHPNQLVGYHGFVIRDPDKHPEWEAHEIYESFYSRLQEAILNNPELTKELEAYEYILLSPNNTELQLELDAYRNASEEERKKLHSDHSSIACELKCMYRTRIREVKEYLVKVIAGMCGHYNGLELMMLILAYNKINEQLSEFSDNIDPVVRLDLLQSYRRGRLAENLILSAHDTFYEVYTTDMRTAFDGMPLK